MLRYMVMYAAREGVNASLNELIYEFVRTFMVQTKIENDFAEYKDSIPVLMLILGFLFCFFGFKVYRGALAIIVFMMIAIYACFYSGDIWDYSDIVIYYLTMGCISTIIIFYFKMLDGCLISAFICGVFGWIVYPNIITTALLGVIGFMAALIFEKYSLYVLTSLTGAYIIASIYESIALFVILFGVGVGFQVLIDKYESGEVNETVIRYEKID